MRFVNGAFAFILATAVIVYAINNGVVISNEAVLVSIAIVTAGALAGGD